MSRDKIKKVAKIKSTAHGDLTGMLASYTMTLSWKANEQWTMESWGEPRGHRGSVLCSLAN
jgi:hypothetical protein